MKTKLILILSTILLIPCGISAQQKAKQQKSYYLNFSHAQEIKDFFKYDKTKSIIVSGHRGGREAHYPENSIEGFENVLSQLPAIFEIDPRLTKDSVIVLMHDATLDRTTNKSGKLSDYTWEELQEVRLKDYDGNITNCKIPLLEDVFKWAKGKTVINLDKKDVPLEMIVELIKKYNAETYVMLTVHTGAQARYYYDRFPNIMMSVFARTDKEYEDIAISGVPWANMIAYVGHTISEKNQHIVEKLRSHGVRCMISTAPTHDKLKSAAERAILYKEEIAKQPDIIESDIPSEVWQALKK